MATYNSQAGAVGTEEVIQQLNELFGNTLNLDIIRSVAQSCKFDVQESSNHLLELTNQNGFQLRSQGSPSKTNSKRNSIDVQNGIKKSRKCSDIESAIVTIKKGYKVLVILRGLPGSGKSTLAKAILQNTIGYDAKTARQHILSTDDFFMKKDVYKYDPTKVPEAHGWNHQRAFGIMSKGFSPVIIDNTNSQMWEMKPYAIMATDYGYILEILEPDTHWCFNDKELAKRNTHEVPKVTIQNMMDRYEKNVTPMKLLTAYDCKYKLQKPPQYRLYPPLRDRPVKPAIFSFDKPKPRTPVKSATLNQPAPLRSAPVAEIRRPMETINLMDFDEIEIPAKALEPIKKLDSASAVKSKSANNVTVDNIFMHDDSPVLKPTILKPTQSTSMKQSTSLFDNIQNAWGVDEKALRSWDIVTPLRETRNEEVEVYEIEDEPVIETREVSTSTDNEDFRTLRNVLNCTSCDSFRILNTCNRDINRNVPVKPQGVSKKLMLDKSCLTEDYFEDQNRHLENLTHLFPHMPLRALKYWYNKCNQDILCTVELLLNEREELISVTIDEDPVEPETEPSNTQEPIVVDSDSGSSSSSDTPRLSLKKMSKHKRNNHSSSSDESKELKKCIESKFSISDDHYSEKLLKVKQQKFGRPPPSPSPEPGTSSAVEIASKDTLSDMDISDECNTELDDVEWEESSPEHNAVDDVETVELNIGEHFVKQLEDLVGDPNLLYPKGFQPVLQMPVALARQLYTFYIESVYQQMEAQNSVLEELVKEDEEFARKLQENEEQAAHSAALRPINVQPEPTEIPDIMREQKELSKCQKEADKWKELTPDTLAARLTKEKLFSVFPSLDRDTLVEILHAHDNVYKDTVETLLASTNITDVRGPFDGITEPPIDKTTVTQMWEDHESCKVTEANEAENVRRSAEDYREAADRFLKKRSDLYIKAQRYHQCGMTEVAQFYSGLASQQTRLYEKSNSFAATAFVDEHSKRLEDFNTLDLHRLYVKEAIPTLDMFLDRQINLLRLSTSKQTEYLQIITGRGKNSKNGVAKIRPAVIGRLSVRKIGYHQLNPGLLKIKITKNSSVTSDL